MLKNLAIKQKQHGQSLVEMALIAPLLLLMLLGVFEVGYALRGYLVLVNANREAARFASRGRFVDFNPPDGVSIGYENVVTHTLTSLACEIDFRLDTGPTSGCSQYASNPAGPNATIIISHYFIDTGYPCDPAGLPACNCSGGSTYPNDDTLLHPGNTPTYTAIFPISNPLGVSTHFDATSTRDRFRIENDIFNCNLLTKDPNAVPSINSIIIVETWYEQRQLLGAPIISQLFPNPVPLYASTVMRITADTRSSGTQ
ncbi:MAG: TadE/TadG family type IV pilus assembly protein [Anaerolineae bacterium]